MADRRRFIKKIMATGALSLHPWMSESYAEEVSDGLRELNKLSPADSAKQEINWSRIAKAFTISNDIINLNNGGMSPQPKIVQKAIAQNNQYSNLSPTYFMWRMLDRNAREPLRLALAEFSGVSPEELCLNRNTTEGLGTVTWGVDLKAGDEIVMTKQDYPNMIHAWKQREQREGVKIKWINFDFPLEDEEAIVMAFINATTPATKIWHITHLMNWTGQILPVKRLCEEARKRHILSIVDGAHSWAHLNFKISDINPDFFATSFHKWLCGPFGTGMLFISKPQIASLWPLFPTDKPKSDNIRKFENLGGRSHPNEMAVAKALSFHQSIGSERKEIRLRYLKNYWCQQLKDHPRIHLHVSLQDKFSCGIGAFSIEGLNASEVESKLNSAKIHTSPSIWENLNCVRVSPNVYTSTKDLDRFLEEILKIANG